MFSFGLESIVNKTSRAHEPSCAIANSFGSFGFFIHGFHCSRLKVRQCCQYLVFRLRLFF